MGSSKVLAEGSKEQRGANKGFKQGFRHLCLTSVPLHFSPHAFVGPLGRLDQGCCSAMRTRGYAGPDGLGCTDLNTRRDTNVLIPRGTTIARIRLTRTLFANDK